MGEAREHPYIAVLKRRFADGRVDRREFLRSSTLLGLSAAAAYAFAGKLAGGSAVRPARAQMPKGGTLRLGMAVQEVTSPHTYEREGQHNIARNVCEYLTKTGHDNVTRPYLLREWQASDDLQTWTLHLRDDVTWRSGRAFTAEDVVWNLRRVLDERTGSSVLGLMMGYMLEEYQEGGATRSRLWDANAVEKVDSHTVRLNCRTPQLAVPEHLFHYPLLMLDPEDGGVFGIGTNGTGAFELVEHEVGVRSLLRAREGYWGEGPYLERLEFLDLGDDPAATVDALAAQRLHGVHSIDVVQLEALRLMPHLQLYDVPTADTAVVRGKVTEKPFDDLRVRKAMRLAVDPKLTQQIILGDLGLPAEHHHVSPVHPEYAPLPPMGRDIEAARRLLAEAGYPDGIDIGTIDCKSSPSWEFNAVQAIVEQWKRAGIRCKINLMPSSAFWEIWDKTILGFTEWAHRPLGVMALSLGYRSGVPWNESGYANPELDRLLTEAEGILDVDKRRAVMAEIERIMQEDGPIVQPIWRSVMAVMDKRVKGFRMHPTRYIFGNELAIDSDT
jgi:peptide/nickel transport system substrate-binding protein